MFKEILGNLVFYNKKLIGMCYNYDCKDIEGHWVVQYANLGLLFDEIDATVDGTLPRD